MAFDCSAAANRAGAEAFNPRRDGGHCQLGSVTPYVAYESSADDIMVFREVDSSGTAHTLNL